MLAEEKFSAFSFSSAAYLSSYDDITFSIVDFHQVAGAVMTGFGIYLVLEADKFGMTGCVYATITTLLVIGVLVFVTSLLVWCVAWKKNRYFLQLFAAIVFLIIVAKFSCGTALAHNTDQFEPFIQVYFENRISEIETTENSSLLNTIQNIQRTLDCCGVNGPNDWTQPTKYCCDVGQTACNPLQKPGCVNQICNELWKVIVGIEFFIVVLAVVDIGAFGSALALANEVAPL
ncbi:hypothetical protein Aperf_G00000129782 [Anoplocephala perfoliata]